MKTMFYAFCRLYITVLEFVDKKNFEKIILQNKDTVINVVDNCLLILTKKWCVNSYKLVCANIKYGNKI